MLKMSLLLSNELIGNCKVSRHVEIVTVDIVIK